MCWIDFVSCLNVIGTSYSINDRIMLSSVVHLTMTETLRELHIRIPSPPPPVQPKSTKKKKVKCKKETYESPYLIPCIYIHPPPKYTAGYEDSHRQYPESPYFSYIDDLVSIILVSTFIDIFCDHKSH